MVDVEGNATLRHDWTTSEVLALFKQPFNDLLFQAHSIYRENFNPNRIQLSTLLSIKTGDCPEDCKYCPQSKRHNTAVEPEVLMDIEPVIEAATQAKRAGATRFCMGAAWRSPKDRDLEQIVPMVKAVKALGLETCMTLGMLTENQSHALADAGLDYYNHNLDTSPEYYKKVITTRTYEDRLTTLTHVREAGIKVCCGGIIGMGESQLDRVGLLVQLANLPHHPESVPINMLVRVAGTPLADEAPLDPFEFIRTVAVARILMPESYVRLSAGREGMNEELHALAYFAGANSIFCGAKLLTTPLPETDKDLRLLSNLGIETETVEVADCDDEAGKQILDHVRDVENSKRFYDAGLQDGSV
ncbi:MAG: biotin synthase BioB [Gammaproteobacteria bacterium]|jgi:biotin synthase|nr:biotin synthase BioB [Gammaproteobacteria bacterium]MBT4494118.1 biotin synthase BioB [Gammaproteobacteria bacterium]